MFADRVGVVSRDSAFEEAFHKLGVEKSLWACVEYVSRASSQYSPGMTAAEAVDIFVTKAHDLLTAKSLRRIELSELVWTTVAYTKAMRGFTLGPLDTVAFRTAVLRSHLDAEVRLTAAFVNFGDLHTLEAVQPWPRSDVIKRAQLCGAIPTRRDGLCAFAGGNQSDRDQRIAQLSRDTGTPISDFSKILSVRRETLERYAVEYPEVQEVEHRRPTDSDAYILETLTSSGNFPNLCEELSAAGLSPAVEVGGMRTRGFYSLVAREWAAKNFVYMKRHCPGFTCSFEAAMNAPHSEQMCACVRRFHGPVRTILLTAGLQNPARGKEREGLGLEHLLTPRKGEMARKSIGVDSTDDLDAARAFVTRAVIPIAGEARDMITSGDFSDTHRVIIGTPPDFPFVHVAVIVADIPTWRASHPDALTIVTSFVIKPRNFLFGQLTRLYKKAGADGRFDASLATALEILDTLELPPITLDEVRGTRAHSSRGARFQSASFSGSHASVVIGRPAAVAPRTVREPRSAGPGPLLSRDIEYLTEGASRVSFMPVIAREVLDVLL